MAFAQKHAYVSHHDGWVLGPRKHDENTCSKTLPSINIPKTATKQMMQMYLLGPVPVFHCLTTQLHLQLLLNGLQDIRSIVQTFQQQYQQLLCRALVEKSTLEMSGKSPFFVWRLLFFCIFCLTLLSLLPMNLYLFRSARVSFLHV